MQVAVPKCRLSWGYCPTVSLHVRHEIHRSIALLFQRRLSLKFAQTTAYALAISEMVKFPAEASVLQTFVWMSSLHAEELHQQVLPKRKRIFFNSNADATFFSYVIISMVTHLANGPPMADNGLGSSCSIFCSFQRARQHCSCFIGEALLSQTT